MEELLKRDLEERKMTRAAAAKRYGATHTHFNRIVDEFGVAFDPAAKRNISEEDREARRQLGRKLGKMTQIKVPRDRLPEFKQMIDDGASLQDIVDLYSKDGDIEGTGFTKQALGHAIREMFPGYHIPKRRKKRNLGES